MSVIDLRTAARVVDDDGRYDGPLVELRNVYASGVYAIIDAGSREVLYVGESHTGRLYDTITRHFRRWGRPDGRRRRGGVEYDREDVLVAFTVTDDDEAADAQYAEIRRLDPSDNEVACDDCDLPPF